MRALCRHGKEDVRCGTVPDPVIADPRDVMINVTSGGLPLRTNFC
jgi:threonine dehydrogenase-like Zn-dependent dehydrogenase